MARKEIPRELSIYINDKQVVNSFAGINRAVSQTNNEIKNLNKNSETYNEDLARLKGTLENLTKKQTDFKNEIKGTTDVLDKIKNKLGPITAGILSAFSIQGAVSTFVSVLKGAYKTINDFEQSVADLSAITGATGKDLKYLKDQAIILGESTKGGAQQVVEAYKLIASAKPELLDNIQALNQVTEATLTLSQAAGMELPDAATALTDALNQFNAPAEQAGIFVDALANGAKYGAAEIPEVTDALLKFGAVAKTSNIDIKESTALIELLAENGLKGAEAGTALRNVLLKLSAPDALPKEARHEMESLGISLAYLKDKTVPIQEKLEALKPLLKDNASIVKVFGTENAAAAINVISHTDRLKELTSKMGEVGTASQQAAIKMDTVNNKTELLKAKYDSLILSIGSGSGVISSFFKFFIDGSNNALTGLIRLNSSWDDLNKRAKQEGQKSGSNAFQQRFNNLMGTGTDAEIAQSIKSVAERDYKILQKEYAENAKKIKDFNPYAINFGESGKDLQLKKEELTRSINENATIIRESAKKINEFNKAQQDEELKTITETNTAKSELELEAEKKAESERIKNEAKKKAAKDKAAKDDLDRILALAKAQADLANAELNYFIANNRSKLDSTKTLTTEIIAAETDRIIEIQNRQLLALDQDNEAKIKKAAADAKSAEELAVIIETISIEYETRRIELTTQTDAQILENKNALAEQDKQLKAEQLTADNELALVEAEARGAGEAERDKQDYAEKVARYNDMRDKNKITEEEFNRFMEVAKNDLAKKEQQRRLNYTADLLGGLNTIAGALGEMFGQSKELAIVQANISGAQAILGIWAAPAAMPQPYDAILKGVLTAGVALQTVSQINTIRKQKAPKKPKFFDGGHTGSDAVGYDQYGKIVGDVHDNEYVIPKAMTQSPRYANTIAWLEQERTGKPGRKFASGGASSPGVIPDVVMTENNSKMELLLQAVLHRLENPIAPNLLVGYDQAKAIQDLNNERDASTNNGIVSK
jgi:TP901 family phage tail tape measure protein